MPLKKATAGKTLKAGNEEELVTWGSTLLAESPYWPLLQALASANDEALRGANVYVTLGTTKAGDALILTLHEGTAKTSVFGDSLAGLAHQAQDLLTPF